MLYQSVEHFWPKEVGNVQFDRFCHHGTFWMLGRPIEGVSALEQQKDMSQEFQIQDQIRSEFDRKSTSKFLSILYPTCCIQYETNLCLPLC